MIEPIYRSDQCPQYFVDQVGECDFVGVWELSDEAVSQMAHLLWDYHNDILTEQYFRKYRATTTRDKRDKPLDNLAAWAEQGEKLLAEMRGNPYLRESLLPAYENALESWPEHLMLGVQDYGTNTAHLFISETDRPDDPTKDLYETEIRMKALAQACREAVTPDLPTFGPGAINKSERKSYVEIIIDEMLSKHIETKTERRACIRELFDLIDPPKGDQNL